MRGMSPKWGLIFKDEVSVILMTGFSSCYKKEKLKKSVITLRKGFEVLEVMQSR